MSSKKLLIVSECDQGNMSLAGHGTTRYCVTCEALKNGEPVEFQHPWRAMTPEEAIARVKAYNHFGLDNIRNWRAVEIQGSYKP